MSCPRCGYAELSASECPRCGVVFAKLDRPVRPAAKVPVHVPTRSTGPRFSLLDATLWLALVISAGVIASRQPRSRRPASERPVRTRAVRFLAGDGRGRARRGGALRRCQS